LANAFGLRIIARTDGEFSACAAALGSGGQLATEMDGDAAALELALP
jgi:hypothetical protein